MTGVRITFFLLLLPLFAFAQEPKSAPAQSLPSSAPTSTPTQSLGQKVRGDLPANEKLTRLSLQELLEIARRKEPRIAAARSEAKVFAAKAFQGRWARLQGSYEGLFAPITELRGTPLQSDTGDFPLQLGRPLGLFTRHQINLVIPLFTFGKLNAVSELANIADDTGDPLIERAEGDVFFDVKRAYYGALLLDDVLDLLIEGATQLEQARDIIEEGIKDDTGDFFQTDLYKLEIAQAEILSRAAEARAALALARTGLGVLSGTQNPVHPKEDFLVPIEGELPLLEELKTIAMNERPEARLLALALRAKTQETKVAKASLFPDFGLLLAASGAYSPVVDNQTSPFAFDPFNQALILGGLGIKYSLDIGVKVGKLKEAKASREQVSFLRDAALGGIGVEIEKAYQDAKSAKEIYLAREEADRAAKKWVRDVFSDFSVGAAETRDLIEAFLAAGDNQAKLLEAIFNYNLSIGKLSRAVGRDVLLSR